MCTLPPCSRHLYSATWVHSDTTWLWKLHKMEMPTCNKDWPGSSGLANHLNALVYKCYLISTMHSGVTQSLCLHNISQIPEGRGQAARCWCCCSCCSCWLEMFRNYSAGKLAALSACFSVCTTPHTPDTQKFCLKHNYRENLIHTVNKSSRFPIQNFNNVCIT